MSHHRFRRSAACLPLLALIAAVLLLVLLLLPTAQAAGAGPTPEQRQRRRALTDYARRLTDSLGFLYPAESPDDMFRPQPRPARRTVEETAVNLAAASVPAWAAAAQRAGEGVRDAVREAAAAAESFTRAALGAEGLSTSAEAHAVPALHSDWTPPAGEAPPLSGAGRGAARTLDGETEVSATPLQRARVARCYRTPLIVPVADAAFECADGGSVDAEGFLQLTAEQRQTCDLTPAARAAGGCLCPLDTFWGGGMCLNRFALVTPSITNAEHCRDPASASVGLSERTENEYCLSVTRNQGATLRTVARVRLMTDAEMRSMVYWGDTPAQTPLDARVLLVSEEAPAVGTYLEVSRSFYTYALAPPADFNSTTDGMPFALQPSNPLFSSSFFVSFYSFVSPGRSGVSQESLADELLSMPYNGAEGLLQRDVAVPAADSLPADVLEGGQMYVEVGVRCDACLRGGFAVSRVHVEVTDAPLPPRSRYTMPLAVLYVVIIAVVVAVVLGIIFAILWFCCTREREPDDQLVSAAQRRKNINVLNSSSVEGTTPDTSRAV